MTVLKVHKKNLKNVEIWYLIIIQILKNSEYFNILIIKGKKNWDEHTCRPCMQASASALNNKTYVA